MEQWSVTIATNKTLTGEGNGHYTSACQAEMWYYNNKIHNILERYNLLRKYFFLISVKRICAYLMMEM